MNYSKIYVQYRDGGKPKGVRVVLGFRSGMGGMTKEFYTDAHGVAIVAHSGTGPADVYVSGKKCTSFHAPGETTAFI